MSLRKDVWLRAGGVALYVVMIIVNKYLIALSDWLYIAISMLCIIMIVYGMSLKRRLDREEKYK